MVFFFLNLHGTHRRTIPPGEPLPNKVLSAVTKIHSPVMPPNLTHKQKQGIIHIALEISQKKACNLIKVTLVRPFFKQTALPPTMNTSPASFRLAGSRTRVKPEETLRYLRYLSA